MMRRCRSFISTAARCRRMSWAKRHDHCRNSLAERSGSIDAMKNTLTSLFTSVALCAVLPLQAHAELDVVKLKAAIETSVESDYPKLDALYKDIHAHPELAFQEVKTAAILAAEMRATGFEVTEKVGRTGVVAI